jgi:Cu+-exporting ATPase
MLLLIMNNEGKKREKLTLPLQGMTCASCAATIEKALYGTPGVFRANVNLASEKVKIEYDTDKVDIRTLTSVIYDTGYGVPLEKVTFSVVGMTCASCVAHVEKALSKTPGVISNNVNLATEKATVEYDPAQADIGALRKAIEDAGYSVEAVDSEQMPATTDTVEKSNHREIKALRNKLVLAGIIGAYMLLVAISSFSGGWLPSVFSNRYLLWALTTPVQFWAGWQFYRGAWGALKHKTANMNTLIAVGTSSAYLYSVVAILFPDFFTAGGREAHVYFDTASIIIALILTGRLLEAHAKGQTSDAIKKGIGRTDRRGNRR